MNSQAISFQEHYTGRFINMLRWHQLDELWEKVKINPAGWYIYCIGESLPMESASETELKIFIEKIDKLLHIDHDYNYCGIVYADDKEKPTMIKIFDPNNLGAVCGSSNTVVPPGWLLTRIQPELILNHAFTPLNRKRWWQRLFVRQ